MAWQLAQSFWVGGLWLLHFALLPALSQLGLAPLLIDEVADGLRPLLVGFAAFCAVLQVLVLIAVEPLSSLWRDLRGQLLLAVLAVALAYFAVHQWLPRAQYWLLFGYLVLAFAGLLLVVQPVPERGRK